MDLSALPVASTLGSMEEKKRRQRGHCDQINQTSLIYEEDSIQESEALSSPDAFSPDAKKSKTDMELTLCQLQENFLKQIKACHEDLARRIGESNEAIKANQKAIEELKESSEFLHQELQDTKAKTAKNEATSSQHERNITSMMQRIAELELQQNAAERHSRRQNLRLHGVPEEERETLLKKKVTDICHAAAPRDPSMVGNAVGPIIDICHRLGPRRREDNRPRPIIIRFHSRELRDHVWNGSKTADIMKARRLRFTEDLTSKDKETRKELWPQVEEARKANKRAYFVGAKAFIDGKEIKLKK